MTEEEFIQKYHCYRTESADEANKECAKVNLDGLDSGENVVVANFNIAGKTWYCLMLKRAWEFARML